MARRSADCPIEIDGGVQTLLHRDGACVFGLDQKLLRVDHEAEVGFALDILEPGEPRRRPSLLDDLVEQRLAGAGLVHRGEGIFRLGQRG